MIDQHRLDVSLDNGKYRYIVRQDGSAEALRHDESWQDLTGNKFVYSLAFEVNELRERERQWEAYASALEEAINHHLPADVIKSLPQRPRTAE